MNTFENETTTVAPNANDFIGGNYLKKEDIDGAITVTDITYVKTTEGWVYLACVLDLFSRKIVGRLAGLWREA